MKLIIIVRNESDLFEVFEKEEGVFVGYFNGVLSVSSACPNTAYRGLIKKHCVERPQQAANVVDLAQERARRRQSG